MGQNNYIVAIEISSSKISGAVSIETYEGTRILAATSIPADGFISRGTVRNVDKTSEAINCIINNLEEKLTEKVEIKRAYISLAGLSIHSIKSKVTRCFESHTKITPEIIGEMEDENDAIFQIPEGYYKVTSITQEYRMDGKTERNPIGIPAMNIEGNYLNIVIKKQYKDQLDECFEKAKLEIFDSFIAARMEGEIRLSDDERNNGCALADIGAETTTVTIYNNGNMRKLVVLPVGSMNVTRDLCSENITADEAEEIKITRGYKSNAENRGNLDNETINSVINARYGEILQNVKYQIEESGELIQHIIFTGGGSMLKNFMMLTEEYLPEFNVEVKPAPKFNLICAPGVNTTDTFSATLYGLLNRGKDNCCEQEKQEKSLAELFEDDSRETQEVPSKNNDYGRVDIEVTHNDPEEERRNKKEEEDKRREEERVRLEEEKKRKEEEKAKKKEEERIRKEKEKERKEAEKERKRREREAKGPGLFGSLWEKLGNGAKNLVGEITSDEEEYSEEDENNK